MLKYKGEFFKNIKATMYYKIDSESPYDEQMEKILPASLARFMLYDISKVSWVAM